MVSAASDIDNRCWPCTVANMAIGLLIAWVPFGALFLVGNSEAVAFATAWGVTLTAFTVYRLVGPGYLPMAGRVAKATGLHDRIGPGRAPGHPRTESRESSRRQEGRNGSG